MYGDWGLGFRVNKGYQNPPGEKLNFVLTGSTQNTNPHNPNPKPLALTPESKALSFESKSS